MSQLLNLTNLPGHKIPEGAVYIGRWHPWTKVASKWANPYKVGKDGTREEVIAKYKVYLDSMVNQGKLDINELRGKTLVCFCVPLACHGTVLLDKLADYAKESIWR